MAKDDSKARLKALDREVEAALRCDSAHAFLYAIATCIVDHTGNVNAAHRLRCIAIKGIEASPADLSSREG